MMHNVSRRGELGVLDFTIVKNIGNDETIVNLPLAFDASLNAKKLTIDEDGSTAESGMILQAENGQRIVVTAGAYPYTLAIDGFPTSSHGFEPEYPLEKYQQTPLP